MRRCAIIVAFFAAVAAPAPEGTGPPRHVPNLADPCLGALGTLNENASIALGNYSQNNGRWWRHYVAEFFPTHGPELFRQRTGALKEGHVVIDVGSGKGIAMMQLAQDKPGVKTVAINAQDPKELFDQIDGLAGRVRTDRHGALAYATAKDGSQSLMFVDGVAQRDLVGAAMACGFPPPKWLVEPLAPGRVADVGAIERDLDGLAKQFREWRAKAPVEFVVGAALEKLKGRENTADVLTDVYGAFFYGTDRLALLEAYYATLKPGGVAFIDMGRLNQYGGDEVFVRPGQPPTMLSSYLVGKFPDIFDVYQTPNGSFFLVMEKPPTGPDKLSIPLKVTRRENYHQEAGGFVVPKLTIKPK